MRGDRSKPCVIYMATNRVNGKRYIGVTSYPVEQRARFHASNAKSGKNNGAFHRAIRKYGIDVFDWSILEECSDCHVGLNREVHWVSELVPEYNSTKGGDGAWGLVITEDGKRRISEANKGNKYNLGKKRSDKIKARMREIGLNSKHIWNKYAHLGPKSMARAVVCISDGTTHESASGAARHYGLDKSSVIEVCRRNPRRKSAGGRVFRYLGDHDGGFVEADRILSSAKRGSKTGLKGVESHVGGKWKATIRVNGKKHYLGLFETPELARSAYVDAEKRLKG